MQIDPTKIKIESHTAPIWEQEQTFQEMMAEQVKHAPWLGIAIVIHVVAFLILASLDYTQERPPEKKLEINIPEEKPLIEEPEEPEEEPEIEEQVEEPVLQDTEVTEVTEQVNENFEEFTNDHKDSAFDSNSWNSALGLGGGAGGKYGGRGGRGGGKPPGGKATAVAIELGLQWLKDHQDEDGKWDCDGFMKHDDEGRGALCDGAGNSVHDVGVTGLALLAFLGDGSTLRSGAYKDTIKEGVGWLREQQGENGLYGNNASHDFIYSHAIATYAMTEAYGLSEYKLLRKYAQRGIDYLESHRNPYMVWRYQPRDNDNDTSVTGWCVMAYESGKYFELDVNDRALKLCETWFDQVAEPVTGRHGYTKRGELSSRHPGDHSTRFPPEKGESMTAVALFCRYFMGQDPKEHDIMNTAADLLLTKPPEWDEKSGVIDHYYWYYASYALYQAGGRHWKEWSKRLTDTVVKNQRTDGNFKGSWDPIGAWGEDGGRVYSTALLVLTLEVYYRYTRLIR